MQANLFLAVLAGLGGMLGWGFSEFATKKSVDRIGTVSSLVWAHVFGTVLLALILIPRSLASLHTAALPSAGSEWLGLVFFGTLQTAVYYFAYKGFEKGHVSILSPIFASFAGIVALLSVLVFGESFHLILLPALLLIFGGTLLINIDPDMLRTGRIRVHAVPGLFEICIATGLATAWTLGWDRFSGGHDWLAYTTWMFVFMTLSALLLALVMRVDLFKSAPGIWKFVWLIAIGEVVGYLGITLGYANTSYTSVVAILSGASSLPTILLARAFLKERMTKTQAVSCAIIIGGILLLSVS